MKQHSPLVRRPRVRVALSHAWLLVVLLFAGAGCRTYEPLLHTADGTPLERIEPAAVTIAVAPVELMGATATQAKADLEPLKSRLQLSLVGALREMNAASEVFAVSSDESFDAYTKKADVMLRPRLKDAEFARLGASNRAFVSCLLWLTTWVGSLYVEDAEYDARMVLGYDVVDPYTGAAIASDVTAMTDSATLSFFDRNEAFTKGFFLSMLVPPFLTGDNEAMANEELERRATRLVAAQMKSYLTDRFPRQAQNHLASIVVNSPRNGARVSASEALSCQVTAKNVVTEVQVFVNDQLTQIWNENTLPSLDEQKRGELYRCSVRLPKLALVKAGKNKIRIVVNVAGRWSSRSIVVERAGTSPTKV